jgi:acetyltransferase
MVPTPARALYHRDDLHRLIDPQVVAIVGASETRGSFGERTLSNMSAFTGKVYAINPKYQNLLGRPCVPSLIDMPETPDCVVLCVARPMVEGMIESAAAVKAAVLSSMRRASPRQQSPPASKPSNGWCGLRGVPAFPWSGRIA